MRKADAAEWLLSMTTTPERAATTAGDLAEEAGERGPLWFWWSLLRTTASLVWRAFAEAPLPMAGIAFRAWLLEAKILGFFAVILNGYVIAFGQAGTATLLASETVMIGCYFCVGQFLARRAPERALPACLAFVCLDQILWAAIRFSLSIPPSPEPLPFLRPLLVATSLLALLAGIDRLSKQSPQTRTISQ